MKNIIISALIMMCITTSAALACEPVDIFGKVTVPSYQGAPAGARAVVIVDLNSGALYVTPIENSNYAIQMPGCTRYTVGTPSVRGMWFRSFTVDVGENEAVIINFVGIQTRTRGEAEGDSDGNDIGKIW